MPRKAQEEIMRIITYEFYGNDLAKEETKKFINANFEDGHYKAIARWTRSRKSKKPKIVRVDFYRIGSSSKIYSLDLKESKGYVIRRGKVIEQNDILTVHSSSMYIRWNGLES